MRHGDPSQDFRELLPRLQELDKILKIVEEIEAGVDINHSDVDKPWAASELLEE